MPLNLFGETRVSISGNPKLAGIANHIMEIKRRTPNLLDGDSIGEINRKVHLEVMLDNGLIPIIQSGDVAKFREWYIDKKQNSDTEEECARALRYLAEHDYERLPAKAVQDAERQRQRISNSVKH